MAQKQIKQYTEETTPVSGDWFLMQKASNDETVKVGAENIAPDGTITPDKLALGSNVDTVVTSQTTTSLTAVDLATAGPSVTVTVGANGIVLLLVQASFNISASTSAGILYYVASGANTIAATSVTAGRSPTATQSITLSGWTLLTGLTAGSTTFKMQYAVSGNTGTFGSRYIAAIPL